MRRIKFYKKSLYRNVKALNFCSPNEQIIEPVDSIHRKIYSVFYLFQFDILGLSG